MAEFTECPQADREVPGSNAASCTGTVKCMNTGYLDPGARDKRIDVLRFIGLSLIILAHASPPGWLQQIRNFDVPLMVIVSGLAFARSTSRQSYPSYLWKRIKRLVFPTWIFLTFYFLLNWAVRLVPEDMNAETIASSYAFLSGIGYIWIIRVFLLIALTAPLIRYASRRIDSNKIYLLILLICWGGYELFLHATIPYASSTAGEIVSLFVYYAIGYSLILGFGVRLKKLTGFEVRLICIFSLVAFVVTGCIMYLSAGGIVPTQRFKYPPSIYYLSYAMFACCLLWIFSGRILKVIEGLHGINRLVMFAARNSIWIYLWHIMAVKLTRVRSSGYFLTDYAILCVFGVALTWVQVRIVNYLVIPRIKSLRLK